MHPKSQKIISCVLKYFTKIQNGQVSFEMSVFYRFSTYRKKHLNERNKSQNKLNFPKKQPKLGIILLLFFFLTKNVQARK